MNTESWPSSPRRQLAEALTSFDERCGVVLYGDPGVGKRQLAASVREHLPGTTGSPWVWFSVVGSRADAGTPLAAVDGLLGSAPDPGLSPRHLVRAVHSALLDRAGDSRIGLLVHDAHLLDTASAGLISHLCRLGGVWLLATAHTGHVHQTELVSLWRDDLVSRIDVPPFTTAEVSDLLHAALDGPVDIDLVRDVVRSTQGNALFVREYVRAGLAAQTIVRRHDMWVTNGRHEPNQRLLDLVGTELDSLTGDARAAVELIALAEPVALALVRPHITDEVLDELVASRTVRIEDGLTPGRLPIPVLRLAHPVYAACVRGMTTLGRRHALYRQLYGSAGQSSHHPHTLGGFLRWAEWTLECGVDISPSELVRAARAASTLGDEQFAISAATAAIDRTDDTPTAVEALAVRARTLQYLDRPVQALRDVDAAIQLLREIPTSLSERMADRILSIHELRAEIEQYGFDRPRAAIETIDRVYGPLLGRQDRSRHSRRHRMIRTARHGWAGDLRTPLTVVAELAAGSSSPDTWDLQAVAPTVLSLTWTGRTREAWALADLYESGADRSTAHPLVGAEIHLASFFSHLAAGRLDEARRVGPDLRPIGDAAHLGSALTHATTARLLMAEGRWEQADQHFRAARRMFEVRDPSGFLAWCLAGEARCAMLIGDPDRARACCRRIEHIPWRASRAFEADIRAQVAATFIGLGDCDGVGRATALAIWAQENAADLVELEALHLVSIADPEIARSIGSDDRARHLAGVVDAPIAAAMATHVAAAVGADTDLQDAASRQLAGFGRWVPRRPVSTSPLSRRETEIATMVAAGLTSPVIAERLQLSPRTVETHVSRVFAKLGVNRRSAVADALRLLSA